MKITREADYALRIIALLCSEKNHVEAKQIAEKKVIPYRFTLKILRKLVQADIIRSYRGINGGYALNKKPEELTFKTIIEAIDGQIAINRCIEEPEICANAGECNIQKKLLAAQKVFENELEKITFDMIMNEEPEE